MPLCTIYNHHGDEIRSFSTEDFDHRVISVGRSSKCSICLKGLVDRRVGRIHFSLEHNGRSWQIRNCSSTCLYHNEQDISTATVNPGDVFRFAKCYFAFGEEARPSPYDFFTTDLAGERLRTTLWKGKNTVGSSSACAITIKGFGLSREHACLTVTDGGVFIEDIGSVNGTFLDNKRVKTATKVDDEMVLRFGKSRGWIVRQGEKISHVKQKRTAEEIANDKPWVDKLIWILVILILLRMIVYAFKFF